MIEGVYSDNWQLSASEIGQLVTDLEDIGQCIRLICETQKGTDPLRPTFGVDKLAYIDKPVTIMVPGLIKDMTAQIAMWEPRAIVDRITYRIVEAQVIFTIYWTSSIGSSQTTIGNV